MCRSLHFLERYYFSLEWRNQFKEEIPWRGPQNQRQAFCGLETPDWGGTLLPIDFTYFIINLSLRYIAIDAQEFSGLNYKLLE